MKKFCIVGVVVSFLILVSIPMSFGISNNDTNVTKEKRVEINDSEAISIFEKTVGITKTDVERKNVIKAFYMIRPSLKYTEIGKNLSSTINETTEQQSGQVKFEDGTPYIIDLLQVAVSLDNETQSNILSMVSATPTGLDNTTSTDHFDIHYTLDPASPDNTTIDFVNELADDLENKTYQTEVTEWGYREGSSGSSKYQVYVEYMGSCAQGCVLGDTVPTLLLDTTININNQISGSFDDSVILRTSAHEYHHASQNSYASLFYFPCDTCIWGIPWVYEGSAAWMEHEVFRKYYPDNVIDDDFRIFKDRMNIYMKTPYKDIGDNREYDDGTSAHGYPSGQYQ